MDDKHYSPIEMDLLRSYVQQFYEEMFFANPGVSLQTPPQKEPAPVIQPAVAPKPPVTAETEVIAPPAATPSSKVEEVPVHHPEPQPPTKPTPKQEKTERETNASPSPLPTEEPKENVEQYDVLFNQEKAKVRELIDQLNEAPIDDLNRAIGLNDRIWFIKDLFASDESAFEDAIWRLNHLRNIEEAKRFIISEIAPRYDWIDKDRNRAAKKFVKIVRRRYNPA